MGFVQVENVPGVIGLCFSLVSVLLEYECTCICCTPTNKSRCHITPQPLTMATFLQWSLSSVLKVAIVERFDCVDCDSLFFRQTHQVTPIRCTSHCPHIKRTPGQILWKR